MSSTNLIHILFSGPLLMYVGHQKPQSVWVYRFLLFLGIFLVLFFAWHVYKHLPLSQKHVWLILHAVVFGVLLIYVGIKGTKAPRVVFSLLLAIGIAAFGYHLVRLIDAQFKK